MIGIGIGINRNRYAQGIFNAYSARVVADGGVVESGACVDAVSGILLNASLLLIPSGYRGGKLYAEIPTNGNGDLTWTRGSDAFRTNASGLIQRVPWNLWQRSEEFMNVAWIKSNTSITANTTTSPNGTLTADTLSIGVDASAVRHRLAQSITATIGTTYTGTYYLKANQHQWIQIVAVSGFSTGVWANFDLVNGTIGNTGGVDTTASIENVGGGWYRCRVSGVATGTSTTGFEILTTNNTDSGRYPSYQSLVAEDVCYVWGAQLVEGTTAQTYLPTTDRLGFPRLDYTYGSCPSALLEPQRTNDFIQSENLFTTHLVINLTTSGNINVETSPDGTQNADKFVPNTTSGAHGIANGSSLAITSGQAYTFSAFVKADGGAYNLISLTFDSTTAWGVTKNCIFNASTGASYSVPSGATMSSENMGNGWYRIRATLTASGSVSATLYQYRIYIADSSGNLSFSASSGNTAGIYVWGAQIEAGAYPTTYIPTTSATATRVADSAVKTGISSLIGQTEGVLFWEGIVLQQTDIVAINRSTVNGIYINKGAGNLFRGQVYFSSNVFQFADTIVRNTNTKIAIAYKSGDSAFFINGSKIGSTNTTAITFNGALSEIRLNDDFLIATAPQFTNKLAIYNTRLTDAECQTLTTL